MKPNPTTNLSRPPFDVARSLPAFLLASLLLMPGFAVPANASTQTCASDETWQELGDQHVVIKTFAPVETPDGVEYPPEEQFPGFEWGRQGHVRITTDGCVEADADVPVGGRAMEIDRDGDGMGDDWADRWNTLSDSILQAAVDSDDDELQNVEEFRWDLIPICLPLKQIENCQDREQDATGAGGDGWLDGPEVAYWNDTSNDALDAGSFALTDSDRLLDSDNDGTRNVEDPDSDNDGLLDGIEAQTYGSFPEYADSDCTTDDAECSSAWTTGHYDPRTGHVGTGDGLNDSAELAAWNHLGTTAWSADFDGDGLPSNLLDPDADDDGLLDAQEFLLGKNQARPDTLDTDSDGLPDGDHDGIPGNEEVAWSEDTDLDGFINCNDPDSDDDGMPDAWEVEHNFNMVDPSDALLDRDADLLVNLAEYLHDTDPSNPDTEGDLVIDGEEVNLLGTNPHFWDTDHDAMPDRYEAQHGTNPLSADAELDLDGDSFDRDGDGVLEKAWPNLDEYRYGRAAIHDEATQGPWLLGTFANAADTDKDTARDGYEVYYGTDPRIPADVQSDEDGDGLNWTQEASRGTDPSDADTDDDGICDGGRAANCHHPNMGTTGNQPGEADYGSIPFKGDSDFDGLTDTAEVLLWDSTATGEDLDADGDLLGGLIDWDSDDDGLTDGDELFETHTDLNRTDTDADLLSDAEEAQQLLTDPLDADHDNDTLRDGDEVKTHRTNPKDADSDDDGLTDGAEVTTYATNPLAIDTDGDDLPDAWEVNQGTMAATDDADIDTDSDGLVNGQEFLLGVKPLSNDTDLDGMPDGYEHTHDLDPLTSNGGQDADGDDLTNLAEYRLGTLPRNPDTDSDGLIDGSENLAGTDPLTPDTDLDGLMDGPELVLWVAKGLAWSTDHDGDTLPALRDLDSDNDRLTDREELVDTATRSDRADSDNDTLSDFDEIVTYEGQYDPNKPDTDGDGQDDAREVFLNDANGDADNDGLRNGDEDSVYGTDRNKDDSDCDGVLDGPEVAYWGISWSSGGNRLLNNDTDNDGLLDGLEIGTVGTPAQAFYRSLPDMADTDGDLLLDSEEAHNNAKVTCGAPQTGPTAPSPAAIGMAPATKKTSVGPTLASPIRDPASGLKFGRDEAGWYVQGGYGVRLHIATSLAAPSFQELLMAATTTTQASGPPGSNGQRTDPSLSDSDADGLLDGLEAQTYGSDATNCDSDNDGLGDALEVGTPGRTRNVRDPCTHLDADPSTTTDPNYFDTDGDGLQDGRPLSPPRGPVQWEDRNANGKTDLNWDSPIPIKRYCARSGETSASDDDTDDDGISDWDEVFGGTRPFCFDTDFDGLSDGLEQGVADDWNLPTGTDRDHKVLSIRWPTFQGYEGDGTTTNPNDPDSDDDGLMDAFEDVNPNGRVDGYVSEIGTWELDPNNPDTDGDQLQDGRELLVYARSAGTTLNMKFQQAWANPVFGYGQLVYDVANPWETDPRDPDTEADGALDGSDLNPRADAFLAIEFQGFALTQHGDGFSWMTELYVDELSINVPLLDSDLVIKMHRSLAVPFYAKPPPTGVVQPMDSYLVHRLAQETVPLVPEILLQEAWQVDQLTQNPNVLTVNLPEDVTGLNLQDTSAGLELVLKDRDAVVDDTIDLNPKSGQQYEAATQSWNIGVDQAAATNPSNYLFQNPKMDHKGRRDVTLERDEVGILRLKPGDTVPKHFLNGLRQVDINEGMSSLPLGAPCYGTANCVR